MKKLSVILFAAFYLLISTGFTVNVHYCSGKVSSIKLFSSTATSCCCEGKAKMAECCDDQTYYFQMENDEQLSQSFRLAFDKFPPAPISLINFFDSQQLPVLFQNRIYVQLDLPPPLHQPLWLKHCTFTFYG